jgi:hypothetical protein
MYKLIILLVLFCSCNGYVTNKYVVTSFTSSADMCEYELEARDGISYKRPIVLDTCGKFAIGDTLVFTKKSFTRL